MNTPNEDTEMRRVVARIVVVAAAVTFQDAEFDRGGVLGISSPSASRIGFDGRG